MIETLDDHATDQIVSPILLVLVISLVAWNPLKNDSPNEGDGGTRSICWSVALPPRLAQLRSSTLLADVERERDFLLFI